MLCEVTDVLRKTRAIESRSQMFRSSAIACVDSDRVKPRSESLLAHTHEVMRPGTPLQTVQKDKCRGVGSRARLPGGFAQDSPFGSQRNMDTFPLFPAKTPVAGLSRSDECLYMAVSQPTWRKEGRCREGRN